MESYSLPDLSGIYSQPSSISTWIDSIFAAHSQSESVPAQPAPRPLATAPSHTPNFTAYTTPRTRRWAMNGSKRQRNAGRTERVTRSSSQKQEKVTAEVAALQISEDNVSEETTTAEVTNDARIEVYDSGVSDRIAQCPTLSHPKLVALPPSAEPHWISAESRSISSWSQSTPFDTASVFTKTTQQSSSPTKTSGSRSKSPVKSMVDLSLLNREVKRRILDADQFPDEIREECDATLSTIRYEEPIHKLQKEVS